MGLGLPQGGEGDFVPYLKYNAKAGRWYSKIEDQNTGDFEEEEIENPTIVIDLDNIKTGYMKFMAGQAPEYVYDSAAGANDAEKPDDKFKRGFTVIVFSKKIGGLRELSSTAGVVNAVMNKLHDAYEEEKAANKGKAPVVKCDGVTPVESKHGTNYAPIFELVKWTKLPAEFDEVTARSGAVSGPSEKRVPAKEEEDDDDEF